MRMVLPSLFSLCFILAPLATAISIHSHSHSHNQERVEDGAFSPKVNDPKLKKSESELIHEVMLGKCVFFSTLNAQLIRTFRAAVVMSVILLVFNLILRALYLDR